MTDTKPVVLYVDDDDEDRLLLADAIDMVAPDYEMKMASDGPEALKYLDNHRHELPCLLILDLNMPGLNGKEIIEIVRNEKGLTQLAIVAFTTSSNPQDRLECQKYGVDMITKPITFTELKETVKLLLSYCNTEA